MHKSYEHENKPFDLNPPDKYLDEHDLEGTPKITDFYKFNFTILKNIIFKSLFEDFGGYNGHFYL